MLKENDFLNRIEIDNDSFGTIDNVIIKKLLFIFLINWKKLIVEKL